MTAFLVGLLVLNIFIALWRMEGLRAGKEEPWRFALAVVAVAAFSVALVVNR